MLVVKSINTRNLLIAVAACAVFAAMFVALPQKETQAATAIQANWPKSFTMQYCWGATDPSQVDQWCPCADLTLYRRPKTWDVFDCQTGQYHSNAGTWSKTGRWATITFDVPGVVTYTGTKLQDGTYEGMMMTASGLTGVWVGEFN